jgi:hypothetical protein
MIPESDEIKDEEWLLRRVAISRFRTDRTPIVSDSAFEPRFPKINVRDPDLTGISLFRLDCLNSAKDILRANQMQNHAVVGVKVSELKSLGLSVVSDPMSPNGGDRVNGHVLIPELGCDNYLNQKSIIRPILHKLAELVSERDHIFWDPADFEPESTLSSSE